jgi:collagenase-like PrtC family protease
MTNSDPAIELLAPARDADIGIAAVNCGADAVYIGAERFGARSEASNDLRNIEKLIHHAHRYWARVYATVNTILTDAEIPVAVKLINDLYEIGADAVIIQDIGLLMCDLPPLPLFASTQMHNNTAEKVLFLEKIGIQRVILARELSLEEIQAIRKKTAVDLEFFIHGALCVCYSGQCSMSYALGGRSGNRGQCAQPCRRRYSLVDNDGHVMIKDRYLLSLCDLNLSENLRELIQAGISSFKIEGRLKDKAYVMNVVGHYRQKLDEILNEKHSPSSSGQVHLNFQPDLLKTFNRGYTDYFLRGRTQKLSSHLTPKSIGEPIGAVSLVGKNEFTVETDIALHNGDGICFFDQEQKLHGTFINIANGNRMIPDKMNYIVAGTMIYRNYDHEFVRQLLKDKAQRTIEILFTLSLSRDGFILMAVDQDGNRASSSLQHAHELARKSQDMKETIVCQLKKCGDSEFDCKEVIVEFPDAYFLPVALLNSLRRTALQNLVKVRHHNRPRRSGQIIMNAEPYPEKELDYHGNVLNQKAREFYLSHGVRKIEAAAESGLDLHGRKVMTTKYCILFQFGLCKQGAKQKKSLYLVNEDGVRFRLDFDCMRCEMKVIWDK